jgi:hypothetical protein
MKIPHIGVLVAGMLALNLANAGVIDINGSGSESGLSAGSAYDLVTKSSNSHIDNQATGFAPSFSTITSSSGVLYQNYLSVLPTGATLIGATLDYAGLFTVANPSAIPLGSAFYNPSFTVNTSQLLATITSTNASVHNVAATATGYNLWTLFQTDLLAGNNLDITWAERVTFNDHTNSYGNNCAGCSETFTVSSTATFTAAQVSNALHLSYQAALPPTPPTTATPEPASMLLSGCGLMIGGFAIRRRRAGR